MRCAKIIASMMLAVVLMASSCSRKSSDYSLSSDLSAFIDHKIAQNHEGLWNSSSKRFRDSNDNDAVAYEMYAKSYGVHPVKVDVLGVSESTSSAKIRVKVNYAGNAGESVGSAVEEWRFVRDKDGWFYDGSRTISESAD